MIFHSYLSNVSLYDWIGSKSLTHQTGIIGRKKLDLEASIGRYIKSKEYHHVISNIWASSIAIMQRKIEEPVLWMPCKTNHFPLCTHTNIQFHREMKDEKKGETFDRRKSENRKIICSKTQAAGLRKSTSLSLSQRWKESEWEGAPNWNAQKRRKKKVQILK